MKEKYTSGPWKVETEYMGEEGYEEFIKRQTIIKRDGDTTYVIANINWCNPVEANTNLMAAAPEMFEALQDCLSLFALGVNAIGKNGIQINEKREKAREIERKVINALVKARGNEVR